MTQNIAFTASLTSADQEVVSIPAEYVFKLKWIEIVNTAAAEVTVEVKDGTDTRLSFTVPAGSTKSIGYSEIGPEGLTFYAGVVVNSSDTTGAVRVNLAGSFEVK